MGSQEGAHAENRNGMLYISHGNRYPETLRVRVLEELSCIVKLIYCLQAYIFLEFHRPNLKKFKEGV